MVEVKPEPKFTDALGLVDIILSCRCIIVVRTNMTSRKHRAQKDTKHFTLSIVREKLINVRPYFVLAGHLSFQAK
jgi:hypothetical protein